MMGDAARIKATWARGLRALAALAVLVVLGGCDRHDLLGSLGKDGGRDAAPGDAAAEAARADAHADAMPDADGGDASSAADTTDADAADAPPALVSNYVFVTSQAVTIQGLTFDEADRQCNDAATAAKLPGTYRAWLSSSTVNARERLVGARGWSRPDGKPVADTLPDLLAGRLIYPPRLDEKGKPVPAGEKVFTGTQPAGAVFPQFACNDWRTPPGVYAGFWGAPTATTVDWTAAGSTYCPASTRLYCFGVDQAKPVSAPGSAALAAFVSDAPFLVGGGLVGADALCAREARAAGLPGTFLALLSTSQASAASRFADVTDPRWVRLDGLPLTEPGRDLFQDGPEVPLNMTSRRRFIGWSFDKVFTGSAAPTSPVVHPTASCGDWTSTTDATLSASVGTVSDTAKWWGPLEDVVQCYFPQTRVYCLQHDGPPYESPAAAPDGGTPDAGSDAALNYMFITSATYPMPSASAPFEDADRYCNLEATAAGLPGKYAAWLSTSAMNARDRIAGARGWMRPDRAPFADTVDDIVQGRIILPPQVNSFGEMVSWSDGAATGTLGTGVVDPANSCHDWTDARSAMVKVSLGAAHATDATWTMTSALFTSIYNFCGYETQYYCFGVDHVTPLPLPADQGRLAFVTQSTFAPSSGLAAADALCDSEAKAAGLPGSFAALLPTSKLSAADRFASSSTATWVRLDAVALNDRDAVLFDAFQLRTPLNVSSKKQLVPSSFVVTGTRGAWDVPGPEQTCQDWTSASGTVAVGYTGDTEHWWFASGRNCSEANPIYCLQK
jgi:hypothetical protein